MGAKAVLALVCGSSLVMGGAIGVFADRAVIARAPHAQRGRGMGQGVAGERRGGGAQGDFLAQRLDLDADQQKKVHEIFESRRDRFHALMSPVQQQLKALHDEVSGEVRGILRPEQLTKYDEMRQEEDARERREADAHKAKEPECDRPPSIKQ